MKPTDNIYDDLNISEDMDNRDNKENIELRSLNDVELRTLRECERVIRQEIKVVAQYIRNLQDKQKYLSEKITELKEIHAKCAEGSMNRHSKLSDNMQQMQIDFARLRSVEPNTVSEISNKVTLLSERVDVLNKWLYLIASAVAVSIIKIAVDIIIKQIPK